MNLHPDFKISLMYEGESSAYFDDIAGELEWESSCFPDMYEMEHKDGQIVYMGSGSLEHIHMLSHALVDNLTSPAECIVLEISRLNEVIEYRRANSLTVYDLPFEAYLAYEAYSGEKKILIQAYPTIYWIVGKGFSNDHVRDFRYSDLDSAIKAGQYTGFEVPF
jgi:hypothetical protein